jgi:hypothetical protein
MTHDDLTMQLARYGWDFGVIEFLQAGNDRLLFASILFILNTPKVRG